MGILDAWGLGPKGSRQGAVVRAIYANFWGGILCFYGDGWGGTSF